MQQPDSDHADRGQTGGPAVRPAVRLQGRSSGKDYMISRVEKSVEISLDLVQNKEQSIIVRLRGQIGYPWEPSHKCH